MTSNVEPRDEEYHRKECGLVRNLWVKAHTLGRRLPLGASVFCTPTGRETSSGDPVMMLLRPLSIHDRRGRVLMEIPCGLEVDGASIPAIGVVRRIIGKPLGKYLLAAVCHDYLCRAKYTTRADADRIFLMLMADLGVEGWRRKAMWAAVRIAGRASWEENQAWDVIDLLRHQGRTDLDSVKEEWRQQAIHIREAIDGE